MCYVEESGRSALGVNNQSHAYSVVARFMDDPTYEMSRADFEAWLRLYFPDSDPDAEFALLDRNQDSLLTVEEIDEDLAASTIKPN